MFNQPNSQYTLFPFFEPLIAREAKRVAKHNRKSEYRQLAATLTLPEWLATLCRYQWKCAYCRGEYEVLHRLVPFFQGGGSTKTNCAPACKSCSETRGQLLHRGQQIGEELAAVA